MTYQIAIQYVPLGLTDVLLNILIKGTTYECTKVKRKKGKGITALFARCPILPVELFVQSVSEV